MVKNTQRDRVWITALENDNFSKHEIINQVDAGSRTVHDVLKTMVDANLLNETTEHREVERGDGDVMQDVTVYGNCDVSVSETTKTDESGETGVSSGDVSVQTHDETDGKPDTPASDVVETVETIKPDARYIIECPECSETQTRQKNSKLVKDVRHKKRTCGECESVVRLIKDNRPNPPVCPECGDDAIEIDDSDDYDTYIHSFKSMGSGKMSMPTKDEYCVVE